MELWYKNYGLQDIAPEVLENLPLGFPADKVKTALILPDIYNPIWDLDEVLTAEELTRKEEEFDELYITSSSLRDSCRTDFADIQNKKECGGNRQWQNHYLRNWAANTKGKGII